MSDPDVIWSKEFICLFFIGKCRNWGTFSLIMNPI